MARVPQRSFSVGSLITGLISCLTIVGIPFGLWHFYRAFKPRRVIPPEVAEELAFVERATLVMASPLMVNSLLRRPGETHLPGLFLLSFDFTVPISEIAEVALQALAPDAAKVGASDADYVRSLLADEEYQRCRRRRLPDTVTGGRAFYAVDLAVSHWYLPNRHISDDLPAIPCLAESGEAGCIRQIPYWLAFPGTPPPSWVATCPAMLA
jgi:hypothetical protein